MLPDLRYEPFLFPTFSNLILSSYEYSLFDPKIFAIGVCRVAYDEQHGMGAVGN